MRSEVRTDAGWCLRSLPVIDSHPVFISREETHRKLLRYEMHFK